MSSQEIERKFLVAQVPKLGQARKSVVRQGYLTRPEDSAEIRLRQIDTRFFLTLKTGEGKVRVERETEITSAQFDVLWPGTAGRRIEKERWTGPLGNGLSFEYDRFTGDLAPLQLVEVEFGSVAEAQAFEPPPWFGAEVTDDKSYKNKALAVFGLTGT